MGANTLNMANLQDPRTFLRTITIVHLALVAGQASFGLVAYAIIKSKSVAINPFGDLFFYIVPVLALTTIAGGNYLFKQQLNSLAVNRPLREKLTVYQASLVLLYALVQGPSLLSTIIYIKSGNLFYLFISGLITLYLMWLAPKKEKIESDLDLTDKEKIELGS